MLAGPGQSHKGAGQKPSYSQTEENLQLSPGPHENARKETGKVTSWRGSGAGIRKVRVVGQNLREIQGY